MQVETEGKRVVNFGVFACKTIVLRAVRYTLEGLTPRGTKGHELKEVGCVGVRARRQDNGLEETQWYRTIPLTYVTYPLFSKSPSLYRSSLLELTTQFHLELNTTLDEYQRKGHYRSHSRSVGSRDRDLE